jgi:1-acyl-sn-glycerol-3-phosphate acyltransferase
MTDWKFHPARDLALHGIERHRSLQRENGLAASSVRLFWWCALRLYFRIWHRLRVTGHENLPMKPPFILIANHGSHLDAPLLASLLPVGWRDRVFPVAASDTFFVKRSTAAFADWFLNALAIRRKCARSHDLDEMRDKLASDGAVLIIFPEGTRSRTGELQAFHSGIGRLVAQSNIPVVPCHLDGCFRAFPPGGRFMKPLPISLRIHPPIRFDTYPDNRAGWDSVASILREACEKTRDLSEAARQTAGSPVGIIPTGAARRPSLHT